MSVRLGEACDFIEQGRARLSSYAVGERDLSWNVVMATELLNQARQYMVRAIKEASCE